MLSPKFDEVTNPLAGSFRVFHNQVMRQPEHQIAAEGQFVIALAVGMKGGRGRVPAVAIDFHDHSAVGPDEVHEIAVGENGFQALIETEEVSEFVVSSQIPRQELLARTRRMRAIQDRRDDMLPFIAEWFTEWFTE